MESSRYHATSEALQDDPERIKDQQRKGEQEEEKRKAEEGRRRLREWLGVHYLFYVKLDLK